jgi:DNA-nicking Smr family endonuclease
VEPRSNLVFNRNIKQIVKKKYLASPNDKKDWLNFTKKIGNISPKEEDSFYKNKKIDNVPKLDLHGFTLVESNKIVEKFITKSFNLGCKKIVVVTGKGSRSKSYDNPYVSQKLSVLKHSIPEFIEENENLNKKIVRISKAEIKDGGEGAIYIFLKTKKNL